MKKIEEVLKIARRFVELDKQKEALQAYDLYAQLSDCDSTPLTFDEAVFILQNNGNYRLPYLFFMDSFKRGVQAQQCFDILYQAFYEPNVADLRSTYKNNMSRMKNYDYIFQKDFPAWESLKILFFPFDERSFFSFDTRTSTFGELISLDEGEQRNFFGDLSKPVLADNVYDQFQLTYLYDNVRASELCAMDNHIYLHYESFEMFCCYLQVTEWRKLLAGRKFVFLFGSEKCLYPIDFKREFHINYAAMTPQPIGVNEVKRIAYGYQLYTHNGSGFCYDLLDFHPNILMLPEILFNQMCNLYATVAGAQASHLNIECSYTIDTVVGGRNLVPLIRRRMGSGKVTSQKDVLVALGLLIAETEGQDLNPRVAPMLFYPPHTKRYEPSIKEKGESVEYSNALLEYLMTEDVLKHFKYVKTLAVVRRFSNCLGASFRYIAKKGKDAEEFQYILGQWSAFIMNHSLFVDRSSKLFRECAVVRFEDLKLNPLATITAMCDFLDIPWADSLMKTTSLGKERVEVLEDKGVTGFELTSLNRDDSAYLSDDDKLTAEILYREEMELYGYRPQIDDGRGYTQEELEERLDLPKNAEEWQMTVLLPYYKMSRIKALEANCNNIVMDLGEHDAQCRIDFRSDGDVEAEVELFLQRIVVIGNEHMKKHAVLRMSGKSLISTTKKPLTPMPLLKLNEKLLEAPLYE